MVITGSARASAEAPHNIVMPFKMLEQAAKDAALNQPQFE